MAVVSTGFFDGVHLGHRLVLSALVEESRRRGEPAVVATFWPHPRNVLQNDARSLRLLTSLEEKRRLLSDVGVDKIEVVEFTREFSKLPASAWIEKYLKERFGASAIVLGYDNRMGGEAESPEDISAAAARLGIDVIRTPRIDRGEVTISSTKIREAVAAGEVEAASKMLGRRYTLHGVVVAGNRLGRSIGFPTANMQLYEPLKLLPGKGVYFVEVQTLGQKCHGMCNIGVRPTVGRGEAMTVETNIFDFDEDIYGLDIRISFICKIREECCFGGLEQLREQLIADKNRCLSFL